MNEKILAFIPARSGSKELKNKNIMNLNGIPLIAHTINAAVKSKIFDEIHVSTDSYEYAKIAERYGAKVPFMRSKENSTDESATVTAILETISNYKKLGNEFDIIFTLQPTSPLRNESNIKESFKIFLESKTRSLVSVNEAKKHPYLMKKIINNKLEPIIEYKDLLMRRQDYDKVYEINGAIYINYISDLKENVLLGFNETPYIMPISRSVDIDSLQDFLLCQNILNLQNS